MRQNYAVQEARWAMRCVLLILPAVGLGVLAMIRGGVSPALWGQQAAAWLFFVLLARPLRRAAGKIPVAVWAVLLPVFLAASLLFPPVEGVRRWVDLGIFYANAAFLVLPALLIVLCRWICPYPILLCAAAVLCVQPDLPQLTAFSAAALVILLRRRKDWLWGILSAVLLAVFIIRCAGVPVSIEPVEYCEGILTMLGELSWLLQATGVIALAAIPAFWALGFFRRREVWMLCLSVYYAVTMLFAFSGENPVPFMGFGLSPIAGYYLAYLCSAAAADKEVSV